MESNGKQLNTLLKLLLAPQIDTFQWHDNIASLAWHLPLELLDLYGGFIGPDGLRYVRVQFPRQDTYNATSIKVLIPSLIESISGYAIIGPDGSPLYVFSHGDVLSLHLYNQIHVKWKPPWDELNNRQVYESGDELLVGTPSEEMFPLIVRKAVAKLLSLGFSKPETRVLLLSPARDLPSDLTFDIFEEEVGAEQFKWVCGAVKSFLPRHLRVRTIFLTKRAFDRCDWAVL